MREPKRSIRSWRWSSEKAAADTTGLAVVPQHQVPILGTFWWVDADGTYSPKPFGPPAGQNLQVRRISNGHFLVDASATSVLFVK